MLETLKNAFKIKEIRGKILFTLAMIVVIRIGSQLPVPGVNTAFFAQWFAAQTGGAFSFFDAITGGSFINMSILALNINPYITSSIIMQLLTIAIPKLILPSRADIIAQGIITVPEPSIGRASTKAVASAINNGYLTLSPKNINI